MPKAQGSQLEILKVHGHDHVSTAADGGGQYMPVVGIRKLKTFDQAFIAADKRTGRVFVHQFARALQLLTRQVGTVFQETGNPFLLDGARPF